ncbi:LytR/AlgR family response regulator transcription factor [Portibacter lacus]|uniref:HTH LytTR-type domain-containing protein n=1 Tax=Portibacter lacus TaxID=1099794 RepID=A0AA37SSD5_9BACT|nr:LytTR family DNA-binding domain-containing protein [Portibacter lacus]GLR19553.1 hypothetical protein GCM10007940_41690 [Portibacter lacus]
MANTIYKRNAIVRSLTFKHKQKDEVRTIDPSHTFNEMLANKLCIKSKTQIEVVPHEEILYCVACSNYTEVITTNGQKFIMSKTLSWVEDKISSNSFFRVHQSYLINLHFVNRIQKSNGFNIVLKGAKFAIPVSRANQKSINQIFSEQ